MEDNIIYLQFDKEGYFEARAQKDGCKIGMRTENIKEVIHCIRAVNSSLWLLNDYGDKAVGFVEGKVTYETFVESIGGRNEVKFHKDTFPVQIELAKT